MGLTCSEVLRYVRYVSDGKKKKNVRTAVPFILPLPPAAATDDPRVPQTHVRLRKANKLSIIPARATRNN